MQTNQPQPTTHPNKPRTIVGVDPGGTTGLAIIQPIGPSTDPTAGGKFRFNLLDAGQLPWEQRVYLREEIQLWHEAYDIVAVACEAFVLRPGRAQQLVGSDFPSVRIIGILEEALSTYNLLDRLYLQQPSQAKRAAILPEHAHLLSGPHDRDAYRHARVWMLLNRHLFTPTPEKELQ